MQYLRSPKIVLLFLLLIGLLLRIYKLEIFYPWGHDQDLFAWIAKDILVDGHLRLIGQETSIIGVFIGPLFYYLVAVSFALFKMNPLGAAAVTTLISLFTIVSIYWVFSKFFSKEVGLIGAFLYAVSPGTVFLDRWVVPTQPTILWSVWFLYVLFSILKKNYQVLIPLSILIGLIWHVHIAFIPLLVLLPIAFLLSKGKLKNLRYKIKTLVVSLLILITLLTPFLVFEIRHGFQQTNHLLNAVYKDQDALTGMDRLSKAVNSGGRSLAGAFVLSNTVIELPQNVTILLPFLFLAGILYLGYLKILSKNQTLLFVVWFLIVFLGQFFSKRIITEYYYNNLFIILFLVIALILNRLSLNRIILAIYLISVAVWFINRPDDAGGFLYKRQAIEYIKADAVFKGYKCIAINHIEGQPGGGTGFRYLFWLNNASLVTAGNDVPVYSVVNPWQIAEKEITAKFGKLGIIAPAVTKIDPSVCTKSDRQLLPLWGFNN
jgi:4-amino-4-deoxy-L-arabinose transferase-like glycosyltransferase